MQEFDCNFSDGIISTCKSKLGIYFPFLGCCLQGKIVFNSKRSLMNRTELNSFKNVTEFFGIYNIYDYDSTGRVVYKKEDSLHMARTPL